jgi:uncharacterized protein (DUF433 family)
MPDTIEELGRWRTQALYRIGEAHRLTGVSTDSIRRWLQGYPGYVLDLKPPWKDGMGRPWTHLTRLSFLEFVEVLVAGKIRSGRGGDYQEVRKFHDSLAAEWGTHFPFAHENLLAHKGQLPDQAIKTLGQLDYEDGFAARWYPLGKRAPLVSEPRISSGAPTIKGRRVRVLDIRELFEAGESLEKVAYAFDLNEAEVETALRYAFLASI